MSGAPGEGGMLQATSREVGDEDTYSVRRRAGDNIYVADTTTCVPVPGVKVGMGGMGRW